MEVWGSNIWEEKTELNEWRCGLVLNKVDWVLRFKTLVISSPCFSLVRTSWSGRKGYQNKTLILILTWQRIVPSSCFGGMGWIGIWLFQHWSMENITAWVHHPLLTFIYLKYRRQLSIPNETIFHFYVSFTPCDLFDLILLTEILGMLIFSFFW